MSGALELRGVTHDFGSTGVLQGVDLTVRMGETVCLIGPSGCGKSTLLQIAAGLVSPTRGSVALGDTSIVGRPGRVAFMPQSDLLVPWRSAAGNVATALEIQGTSPSEALAEANAMLAAVGLSAAADSDIRTLSGGMRQRVAFVRTLIQKRDAMLLDEPFGALDQLTRAGLHQWLRGALTVWPAAVLIVTHDTSEAVMLGDRVLVMTPRPGRVAVAVEIDRPSDRGADLPDSDEFGAIEREVRRALVATSLRHTPHPETTKACP